jgi:hypothetical protein
MQIFRQLFLVNLQISFVIACFAHSIHRKRDMAFEKRDTAFPSRQNITSLCASLYFAGREPPLLSNHNQVG